MDLLQIYAKEIFAVLAPLLTWWLTTILHPRARLVKSDRHSYIHLIDQPLLGPQGQVLAATQTVRTASVSVVNTGRETATNVEVVFNWTPPHINIWPNRFYDAKRVDYGRHSIVFPSLAPKEFIGIETLSINAELPEIVNVRSEQCTALNVEVAPQEVYPRWKIFLVLYLMLAGIAATAYVFALIVQWIAAS